MKRSLTFILLLLLIFAIGLTAYYCYKNSEKATLTATDRNGTSGNYISLSDGITHYQLSGPDTGQVVVLQHGFSVPYFIWDGTYEYLVKQGFRVLRYDQYGRGFSDRPNLVYNKETYYKQLLDLLQKLKLHTPVDIIGVSFGGLLATDFAGNFPQLVNKVVLIDPVYPSLKPPYPQFITEYYEITHPNERAEEQLADFKYPDRHPNWVNKYKQQMQYKGFTNALVSTLYNYRYVGRESNALLNTRHKDVLLIWGKDDHTVSFRYSDSVRSVLKVTFFPVDNAAHLPYIEQANKVNPKIAAFLRQ